MSKKKKNPKTDSHKPVSPAKVDMSAIHDTSDKKKDNWAKGLFKPMLSRVVAGFLLVLIIFFIAFFIPATNSNRYVFFDRVAIGIPSFSDRTNVIKTDILSQINHIVKDSPYKIAAMLETTGEDVGIDRESLEIVDSQNKQFIINQYQGLGLNTGYIFRELRRILKKNDILINVEMGTRMDSLVTEVSMHNFRDKHQRHWARISKHFTNGLDMEEALDKTTREIAAHAVFLTDPVSSVLCDYLQPGRDVDLYQTVNPWIGNAFDTRIDILENLQDDRPYSDYRHLLLANIKASFGQQAMDREAINEAIEDYHQFLQSHAVYQEQIDSKIQALERYLKSPTIDLLYYVSQRENLRNVRQLIIVASEGIDRTLLFCYEKKPSGRWEVCKGKDSIAVRIGWGGLAEPGKKREGDGKTPSGFFPITRVFGIENDLETAMPFDVITVNHVWVTDPEDDHYNWLILDNTGRYKNNKNEILLSESTYGLNKYGICIDYNVNPIVKGKGSAIYMHIERPTGPLRKTSGCIAMKEKDLTEIIEWLVPGKNPHIWIGKTPK